MSTDLPQGIVKRGLIEEVKLEPPKKIKLKLDKVLKPENQSREPPRIKSNSNIMNRSSGKFHTFIEKLMPENEGPYEKELKSYLNQRKEALKNHYCSEETGVV